MDAAAHAIADPVRRDIMVLLRDGDLTAGEIAARFTITRPAISRHLRVLRAAGLAVDRAEGRRRVYRLDIDPLAALEDWISSLRPAPEDATWDARLAALDTEVHRTRRERTRARAAPPTHTHEEETG